MFGYVTVCEPELKVKDLKKYRAYYCGLCRTLKEDYGFMGQMTLTYDMTFAVILLSSLYETIAKHEEHRCKVHPVKRQHMLWNEITSYAAAMNVLLAYYHMEDDWQDDHKVSSLMTKSLIQGKAKKIIEKYPRQSESIRKSLEELGECEHENSMDIDRAAGCFGRLMAELFVWKEDIWEKTLRKMGFYLGKFIYLMDAYEDLPEDRKKNRYNPLKELAKRPDYEVQMEQILRMMIAESTVRFEQEKFKEVQEAYDIIMRERANGGNSYGNNYGYGSSESYSYGNQSYGNQNSSYGYGTMDPKLQAAANYINSRRYREAINTLDQVQQRSAMWYYLSGCANAGIGNQILARDHAAQAVNMEPNNMQFRQLLNQLDFNSRRYQNSPYGGGYAPGGQNSCGTGNMCCDLWLADTLCECMGGDLCSCM